MLFEPKFKLINGNLCAFNAAEGICVKEFPLNDSSSRLMSALEEAEKLYGKVHAQTH